MTATSWPRPVQGLGPRVITSALALLGLTLGLQALAFGPFPLGMERVVALTVLTMAFAFTLAWRRGVYLILVYVTIEGFVTNLLYPSTVPLFFKDFLIAGAYLGFLVPILQGRKEEVVPSSVLQPFGVLVLLTVVQAFNPRGIDPAVALVGVRVLLFYIPLYALGFHLGREPGASERLVHFILVTSLPIIGYGIYQYQVGADSVAALGDGFARTVWIVGPEATRDFIYRPAATFSFVGHFGAYLLFIAIIAYASLHTRSSWGGRLLASAVFVVTAVAVVLQSQRTTWLLLPVAALGIYLLSRNPRGIARGVPVAVLGLLVAIIFGGSVLENRLPILTSGAGIYSSHLDQTFQPFKSSFFSADALLGHGTGTALGATRYVTGGQVPNAFESGWFVPFYMFGVWGLLAYLWLYAAVLRAAWTGVRRVAADQRWVPVGLFVYLLLVAAVSGPITFPPANVYFWLFAGVLAGRAWTEARPPPSVPANGRPPGRLGQPGPAQP